MCILYWHKFVSCISTLLCRFNLVKDGHGSSPAQVHSPAKRRKLSTGMGRRKNNRSSVNENAKRASFFSRHSQSKRHLTTIKEAIVVEDSPTCTIPANDPIWIKNEHMKLYERDRQIVLSDQWLNDAIVNAAQSLLSINLKQLV